MKNTNIHQAFYCCYIILIILHLWTTVIPRDDNLKSIPWKHEKKDLAHFLLYHTGLFCRIKYTVSQHSRLCYRRFYLVVSSCNYNVWICVYIRIRAGTYTFACFFHCVLAYILRFDVPVLCYIFSYQKKLILSFTSYAYIHLNFSFYSLYC